MDTNVLLDILSADPTFGERSKQALRRCAREGALVACEVVWAELAAWFPATVDPVFVMNKLGVRYSEVTDASALKAGSQWREYRNRGGRRSRVIADFLIAAHALSQADRLLTRDRGFYKSYFKRLKILDPTQTGP